MNLKSNLSPGSLGRVLCRFCFVGFLLALLAGCSAPPSSVERYFFDVKTNLVPVVKLTTNVVERVESSTNEAGGVVLQPIRETVVLTSTNYAADITMVPSPAFNSWSSFVSGVVNAVSPGSGSAVGVALLGVAGLFGYNRQKKLTAAQAAADGWQVQAGTAGTLAQNFAQSIETLRAVVKALPNGPALDARIVDTLRNNQLSVGLLTEAINIVKGSVDSAEAKRAAGRILEQLKTQ